MASLVIAVSAVLVLSCRQTHRCTHTQTDTDEHRTRVAHRRLLFVRIVLCAYNVHILILCNQCVMCTQFRSDMKRPAASDDGAYWLASKRPAVETREPPSSYNYNMYSSSR